MKTVLKLELVEEDDNGKELNHFCCDRAIAFKRFDNKKAEEFVATIQSVAQTIGTLLGFSVY